MSAVVQALIAEMDDDDLDALAALLAPRLTGSVDTSPVLTVTSAARRAGCSERTIRRALDAGTLAGSKVARRWQLTAEDVDQWRESGGPTEAAQIIDAPRPRREVRADAATSAILTGGVKSGVTKTKPKWPRDARTSGAVAHQEEPLMSKTERTRPTAEARA